MRLLKKEEIEKITEEWWQGEDTNDLTNEVAKAQYNQDIKDIIEDLEYHGEANEEPWKTAESFILPMWYLRDLKQLVEE